MKNLKSTLHFSQQCFISGVLLFSTCNAFALSDQITLAKEKLIQQLNQGVKVQPTLYFENNKLRLFGEKNTDLLREKSELLTAIDIFDDNFGPSTKLDVALMNSQMGLFQLDKRELSDQLLPFLSYQGLVNNEGIEANKADKYNIIAHETCHMLLINQVEKKGLKYKSNGEMSYGHGLLPDWYDEMAAVICENQALNDMRLTSDIQNFIPFDKFFIMENPAFTMIKEKMKKMMQQQGKSNNNGSLVVAIEVDDNDGQLPVQFYQQVALFHHFLSEKLGSEIFKRLTRKFVQKADVSAWLLKELSLENVAELDVMFKQYHQIK